MKRFLFMTGAVSVLVFTLIIHAKAANLVAEPEAIDIDLKRTAVVVIDMQNAFVSKGGMFDLRGFDVTPTQKIVEPIRKICDAARAKGIKVIHLAHVLSPDLREVGPESSFWYKSVKIYREDPRWKEKFLIRGTWGSEIVDELKPQPGDIYVEKPRFSAFFGTNLDVMLKTYNLRNLFFVGCATNICVEASIRDAGQLGYWPVLIKDAATNNGPPFMQEATIFNTKLTYGWVTDSENFFKAIK
ncbi:MAG: isochorismatase family protein [Desulfobacteraceae bacterium]|nr:MAG: isochorismatase family protein [Desulfobacteraceae bacterium]